MNLKNQTWLNWTKRVHIGSIMSKLDQTCSNSNKLFQTYSWPVEGQPRPKVPNLGGWYILPPF